MKAIKGKIIYAAALVLSLLYGIEVFTNGKLSPLNWFGIVIAAVLVAGWLIDLGIFISRKNNEVQAKKALKAVKEAKKAKKNENAADNSDSKRGNKS